MKINYIETINDLAMRINIHEQYGSKNIDQWVLDILALKPNSTILDIGCGSGKQCFSFYDYLVGQADIIGGDVNEDLLQEARLENTKRGASIRFMNINFNEPIKQPKNFFDLVSCCFAIYYALDVPFTIREIHRIIKPGGSFFTTGPMPENKLLFYDVIREATNNRPIPPMPGSSRYKSEFLPTIQKLFKDVKVHIFENPLIFETAEPFIAYTRASLNEDRKIWSDFFKNRDEFENIMKDIEKVVKKRIEKDGKLVMTKVVGGFLATK